MSHYKYTDYALVTRWVCVWVGNGFWLGLLSWDLGRHSCFFPGVITSSISRVELILCAVSSACFRGFSFFFYLLSHAIKKAKVIYPQISLHLRLKCNYTNFLAFVAKTNVEN